MSLSSFGLIQIPASFNSSNVLSTTPPNGLSANSRPVKARYMPSFVFFDFCGSMLLNTIVTIASTLRAFLSKFLTSVLRSILKALLSIILALNVSSLKAALKEVTSSVTNNTFNALCFMLRNAAAGSACACINSFIISSAGFISSLLLALKFTAISTARKFLANM